MRQKGCKEAAEWPGGGTPYVRMIGMILVYFRGYSNKIPLENKLVFVRV